MRIIMTRRSPSVMTSTLFQECFLDSVKVPSIFSLLLLILFLGSLVINHLLAELATATTCCNSNTNDTNNNTHQDKSSVILDWEDDSIGIIHPLHSRC